MTTCARSFFFLLGSILFLYSASFFTSFFLALNSSKCFFCISCTVVHVCVSAGRPTCQSAPPTIPAPSHLHSGWIREWPVRGHGLIVQPKNSPPLSPLWAFHLGSFIGPLQHFLSHVARVLGCVGMALILTQTQKHENRTGGGHCT